MNAIEFTAELSGAATLTIPPEVADRLPKAGSARVIVLTADPSGEDAAWRVAAYEHFIADDAPEDAVYDSIPR